MADFYKDNDDIRFLFKHMDLGILAEQLEEDFRFAEEFNHAPVTKQDAIENYEMVLEAVGKLSGDFIAPRGEAIDRQGNTLNEDGTVTNAYGLFVDGTSVWDVGLKITDSKTVTAIDIGTCTTDILLQNDATIVNTTDTLTLEEATIVADASTLFGVESAAVRLGVSATIYMAIAVTDTSGITAITHTGATPTVTWTADSFSFVGPVSSNSRIAATEATTTDVTAIAGYFSETVSDAHGGAAPTYALGIYGKVVGDDYAGTDVYVAGAVGYYGITGTNATIYPSGAVIGWVGGETISAQGAFVAVLGGDAGITIAGAAFTVRSTNSTPGTYFDYGLDLYSGTIGAYSPVTINTADIRLQSGALIQTGSGDPNGSVTGTNGSIYLRTGTGNADTTLYVCTGTTNWTVILST